MNQDLIKSLFTEACSITTSSGKEAEMAVWIKNKLEPAGWEVWTDEVNKKNESDTGNLYAYLEVNPKAETVAFSAHMDTVAKPEDKIKVVFDGKTFKSDGATILGADNRGGLVPIVYFGMHVKKQDFKNNILLFFPTREESGTMGSKFFEFKRSKVKYIFNLDGGEDPGTFVYRALGFLNFKIEIKGLASHAAAAPDKGKNAILVAAELIKSLPLGKNEEEGTTLNIGNIKGGGATNIVPDFVEMEGELRAFEVGKMESLFGLIETKCNETAKEFDVAIKLTKDSDKSFSTPHVGSADSEICRTAESAARRVGLNPDFKSAFYSTDSNNYSKNGYATIVVTRGGRNAHSKDEQIDLADIVKTCELVQELAAAS